MLKKIVVLDHSGCNYYRVENSVRINSDNKLRFFEEACLIIINFYFNKISEDSELYDVIKEYYDYHLKRKKKE